PEHPQFALKTLLAEFGIERKTVQSLGPKPSARNLLASELFRPTETTPRWHKSLPLLREELATAVAGITEIAAPDRHFEARAIALVMREALNHPNKTAALVTPDRDLAQRVVAELQRWNLAVFDSAGEPLSRRGLGAALDLLLQVQLDDFAPAKLFAFLRHPLVSLGLAQSSYLQLVQLFELAVLRGPVVMLESYTAMLARAQTKAAEDHHLHPAVKAITAEDWAALQLLAQAIDQLNSLLVHDGVGLTANLVAYENALHFAIAQEAWDETSSGLLDLLGELKTEGHRRQDATASETAMLLRQLLQSQTQPPIDGGHPRLAILGTIEARLLPFDVMILGGLNETVWPKGGDPGPWLNRSMREKLNLPMPERDIGMAAHDFEQGFGSPQVFLTWSKRLNHAPQSPSRWLLRLKAVLLTAGVAAPEGADWLALAQSLHRADAASPVQKPNFAPPLASRPTRFSVTEVEKLIRNPYAIYARKILRLEPLPDFAEAPHAGLRGSLFHDAIGKWNAEQSPSLESLLAEGEKTLATLGAAQERYFWAPHFKRLADFLWAEQVELRDHLIKTFAELNGKYKFKVEGVDYILTARADRIDILNNNAARIIDYKTGEVPSTDQVKANFSPQLTLEAAMLLDGAFNFKPQAVIELLYFKIGGGLKGLEKKSAVKDGADEITKLAAQHMAGFKKILSIYQDPTQTYLPRVSVEQDGAEQDYDHLSRYLEWQLAEQT
ncbi:MAG: double-strand break repair protein AddB, partial [Aestuariivirga sp.]